MWEGLEPLPRCDKCGMHMLAANIFKHSQSDKRHKETERRIRRRGVEMAAMCGEMEFGIEGG